MTPEFREQANQIHRLIAAPIVPIDIEDRLRELGSSTGVDLLEVCERANTLDELEVNGVDRETCYLFAILVSCYQIRGLTELIESDLS